MKKSILIFKALSVVALLAFASCKKDKKTDDSSNTNDPNTTTKKYALVIDNGAQAIDQGQSLSFSAHLVSTSGEIISATGVTWSSNIGGLTGSTFTFNQDTTGIITAAVDYNGSKYTASVPICVNPLKNTQIFAVVPSAIIWSTNSGPIQLTTVYLGNNSASYSFSSENSGIASVSSSGNVTFNSAGNTRIKVTATIGGQTSTLYVPVMVVGVPEVPLPVTRVVLTPSMREMFRGESFQFSAKAYNSNGDDVTSTVTFSYVVVPKQEDDETAAPAVSVNASGMVTAKVLGGAYIQAIANGVMGQAEVVVNPDTVIMVSPFYVSLGGFDPITLQPGPNSQVFTATTYKVDHDGYRNKTSNYLTQISNSANLKWDLPLTGIPDIDNQFNVITLGAKSNTSVTATKIANKVGSTFVIAHDGDNAGAAAIMVMP